MKFRRYEHLLFGGDVTKWGDKNFPACPLCKQASLWEWANQSHRIHFRCPSCMGVISFDAYVVRKWLGLISHFIAEDGIIETVGKNSELLHLVGQKLPIKTLQEWAKLGSEKSSEQNKA